MRLRIVVMGVAGSGKTAVGARLAEHLDAAFVDADVVHPPANVAKMAVGIPLTDDDRRPWLDRLRDELATCDRIVVSCSALKRAYRDVLRRAGDVRFLHLDVDAETALARVEQRSGHFMGPAMVASQFDTLEPPGADESDVVWIEAGDDLDSTVVAAVEVCVRLGERSANDLHDRSDRGVEAMAYDEIRYEVDDPVATITLSRPTSMNAWTGPMDAQVRDAIERACADPAVVGIVITGEGRAFCAGADMKLLDHLAGADPADAGELASDRAEPAAPDGDFDNRFGYLMAIEKPVVAAVNGAVAGMAYPLVLCCDLRVVCPEALFVTAFAQRGLIAEWGLGWLLPRLVGPAVALDLLLSSRRVGGDEAHRLGLANHLVDRDDLLPYCRRYVEQLAASCSPASMAVMKRQVYADYHRGFGVAEAEAQRLMAESFSRPDFAEGVRSFIEKRPPEFGRLSRSEAGSDDR